MLKIRFISGNKFKVNEAKAILESAHVEVIPLSIKLEEIQSENTDKLVKDKALKAFSKIGRPLFVEHTGLYLNYMNGLPGGLTQIFWDNLEADRFSELFGKQSETAVIAKTTIGYVDGKQFYLFEGEISGNISPEPRGNKDFQWDCVFVPEGYDKTFAELGDIKNEISMRKLALDKFAEFLESRGKV